MNPRSLPASARRHPSATFGAVGGLFALLFVLVASAPRVGPIPGGDYAFSQPEAVLVAGGFVGGALVSWALWTRLGGDRSPRRGAAVGALVGLLALPVPFYLLELALVAVDGVPFDPRPAATPAMRMAESVFLIVVTPLLLGTVGLVVTYGGTVIVGSVTGYLLARR